MRRPGREGIGGVLTAVSTSSVTPVALELLDERQRAALEARVKLAAQPGIPVSAIATPGSTEWHVLLFESGSIRLLRTLTPNSLLARQWDAWQRSAGKLAPRVRAGRLPGEEGLWVNRPFEDQLLVPQQHSLRALCAALLPLVVQLHDQGLVHGHLRASNIAISASGTWELVDIGVFDETYRSRDDIAPEIRAGGWPTTESDLFGLSLVLRAAADFSPDSPLGAIVVRMGDREPVRRPSWEEILEVSGISVWRPLHRQASQISGGRMITRNSARIETHAPPPSVVPQPSEAQGEREAPRRRQPLGRNDAWRAFSRNFLTPRALATALGAIVALGALIWWRQEPSHEGESPLHLASMWRSDEPMLQAEVMRAAIAGDRRARELVTAAATRGQIKEPIRARLLRGAFQPAWSRSLADQDARAALSLAAAPLLSVDLANLPPLSELHPGVLFGILADLPLVAGRSALNNLPLIRLFTLPSPFGEAFVRLSAVLPTREETPLDHLAARVLARVLLGESPPDTFAALLNEQASDELASGMVLVLAPVLQTDEQRAALLNQLVRAPGPTGERARWFTEQSVVDWAATPLERKLELLSGTLASGLSFDQIADLLSFPLPSMRRAALERLTTMVPAGEGEPLFAAAQVLATTVHPLRRGQVVALLRALHLKDQNAYPLLTAWFQTEPDPKTVVTLLANHPSQSGLDPFSVEAARYLKDRDWELPLPLIGALLSNPEPLVRAVVYAKMNLRDPAQRALAEEAKEIERDERLKRELARRLAEPRERR